MLLIDAQPRAFLADLLRESIRQPLVDFEWRSIRQRVTGLSSDPTPANDTGGSQDTKVLRGIRLADS
jgi:hypothetical protein